jgi:hypothetical protein
MTGRIRVRRWLSFKATQECAADAFRWRARVGFGPLTLIRVEDGYEAGAGRTSGKLFGRLPLFDSGDADTTRSAAGRAALEAVAFAPPTLLAGHGVEWRAESDDTIVASFDLSPERPEVRARIDEHGALRSVSAARWGNPDGTGFRYLDCHCDVHAERTFEGLTIPSRITVAWADLAPFFEAEISAAETVRRGRSPRPSAPA